MSYPGGKGQSYQRLISLIPPHRVYVETHLGGGAVMRAKRPAERNIGIEIDPDVVAQWQLERVPDVDVIQQDAVSFLECFPWIGDEFVFSDPPYLPSSRRRRKVYRHDYDERNHQDLLAALKSLPCKVMIAGYPSELYTRELVGWRALKYLARTQAGAAIESLWLNYDPPELLHDYSHIGYGFREREAIRRRRESLLRRIAALAPLERSALYSELALTDTDAFLACTELVN